MTRRPRSRARRATRLAKGYDAQPTPTTPCPFRKLDGEMREERRDG